MDYAHARVRLHFCKVLDWRGEFEMREGQAMAWQTLPVTVAPVLPGTLAGAALVRRRAADFAGRAHCDPAAARRLRR